MKYHKKESGLFICLPALVEKKINGCLPVPVAIVNQFDALVLILRKLFYDCS